MPKKVIPFFLHNIFYIFNISIIIPIQRNGPSAISDFLPAFRTSNKTIQYAPALIIPITNAFHIPLSPSRNPPAAISLMSPPPILPGMKHASTNNGMLTQKTPAILCISEISGNNNTLIIPTASSPKT